MSSGGKIGRVTGKIGHLHVEWTIHDIFTYSTEYKYYYSPKFSLASFDFQLIIWPYGSTNDNGWISLFLVNGDDSFPLANMNYTFGVKKADGTIQQMSSDIGWVFHERTKGFGCHNFLKRSELLERKSELAPSNALTITCNLRVNTTFDFATRTMSANFKDMFLLKKHCDWTVQVKDKTFPVHKSVLSARSPVFDAMLDADMKEKRTGILKIDDCDPTPFRDFLMYIYSGKVENLSSNAFELYKIADKYQVQELKKVCIGYIICNISGENMYDAILLAEKFGEKILKLKIQQFFNSNFSKIVSSDAWESFLKENFDAAYQYVKQGATKMKLQ